MDSYNFAGLYGKPPVERSVYYGVGLCVVIMLVGLFSQEALTALIDVPALILVCGGTFGATLIQFSWSDIVSAYERALVCTRERNTDPAERVRYLIELAQGVKQQGPMYLEHESRRVHDRFLRLALEMTVDGYTPVDMRQTLENDLGVTKAKVSRAVSVLETLGAYAPAMGLIGTLFGLIALLGDLGNTSALGGSMSIALLTTLYGAVLSNMIFLPLAGRIELRGNEELEVKLITIEGALCLSRQESPILVGQRLGTFLVAENKERSFAAA
jgi:chemotaxis protein MotA